jgi:hypothetical protein
MKLEGLATVHPGGWTDIIDVIEERWPELEVVVPTAMWGRTNVKLNKKGEETVGLMFRPERRTDVMGKYILHEFLRNAEGGCSGTLAASAYFCLRQAGLPVPGDKQWLLCAADWRRTDASHK